MSKCTCTLFKTTGFLLSASVLVYNLRTGPSWWPRPARKRMRSVLGLFLGSNVLSLTTSQILSICNSGLIHTLRSHPYVTIFGTAVCVSYWKLKMKRTCDSSELSSQKVNIAWFSYSVAMGVPFALFPASVIIKVLPTYVMAVGVVVLVANVVPSPDYETFSVGWILALFGMLVSSVSGGIYLVCPDVVSCTVIHQSLVMTFFGILLDEFQFAKKRITDTELIPDHIFNPTYVSFPLFAVGSVLLYRLAALNYRCS